MTTPTTKKLFLVTLEYDVAILAHDEREAERRAEWVINDEIVNGASSVHSREVLRLGSLPEPWHDSYPYSTDHKEKESKWVTCREYFATKTNDDVGSGTDGGVPPVRQ